MIDENEAIVTTEEEAPEFQWDLTPPEPEPEKPLTRSELMAILAESNKKPDESPNFREEIIQEATTKAQQTLEAKMAVLMAPQARHALAAKIAKGLPDSAREYLENIFEDYDANGLTAISKNTKTIDALRNTAENVARKGGTKPVPKTEETATVDKPLMDADMEKAFNEAWQTWKDVPGMTKEKAREYMKQGAA